MSQSATIVLKNEIMRFLASSTPEVTCIRGKWGVGKTFAWNKFLDEAKTNGVISLQKYAYISLFGVQSLDQLRYSTFENAVDVKDIGQEPTLESFKTNTSAVLKRIGYTGLSTFIQFMPVLKAAAGPIQSVAFLSVYDRIICIDDIERKGAGLRIIDVLGLISFLRERRRCKVVLILNEEELNDDDRKSFDKYEEKVIESSLHFSPTAEDCADIAFAEPTRTNSLIREYCIKLDISNIRIIKRLERLVDRAELLLREFDPKVLRQAVQTLTLFCFVLYGRNEGLQKFALNSRGGYFRREELSEQDQEYDALLDRYGFAMADDLDLLLIDGIKTGYFDEIEVVSEARKLDFRLKTAERQAEVQRPWDLYHDNFADNEEEILQALAKSIDEHIDLITPTSLSSIVRLLKDLGHTEAASEVISHYISERTEERSFFDLEEHPFSKNIDDPDVIAAFSARLASFNKDEKPEELLGRFKTQGYWHDNDLTIISKMPVADLKAFIKSQSGLEMRNLLRELARYDQLSAHNEMYGEVWRKTKQALEEIGEESTLNRLRVARYLPRKEKPNA